MSRYKRARDAAPIDSAMLEKPGIFPDEERVDKEGRDFVQRDLDPVRAGETAVDFAVHVEDGVAFRHVADLFQVERLRPERVEKQDAEDRDDRQPEEGELPRNADLASGSFFGRSAGEKLHSLRSLSVEALKRCSVRTLQR